MQVEGSTPATGPWCCVVAGSWRPSCASPRGTRISYPLGFGLRSQWNRVGFDLDAAAVNSSIGWAGDSDGLMVRLRALPSYELMPGVALFAGPTFSLVPVQTEGAPFETSYLPQGQWPGSPMPAWFGFSAGARFGGVKGSEEG